MQLTKHHGLGNDFLIALVEAVPPDAAELARSWCHRRTGIGADGLIFGTPHPDADLEMGLFNSDGSRAEISGNGIRCLAQAHFCHLGADAGDLAILAGDEIRKLSLVSEEADTMEIAVEMGPVSAGPPLPAGAATPGYGVGALRVETGEVGNPHVVLEVDDLSGVDVSVDGPVLEELWKPTGINVHFLVASGADEITLTHWERGAGVTAACGSGAVVAATIAHRWGSVGADVKVKMPGGDARVLVGDTATLIGPAVSIGRIEVPCGR